MTDSNDLPPIEIANIAGRTNTVSKAHGSVVVVSGDANHEWVAMGKEPGAKWRKRNRVTGEFVGNEVTPV